MRQALIIAGAVLLAAGLAWPLISRLLGLLPFGQLPGDIRVQRPGFSFYAPLGTGLLVSIILSVVLTLIMWFWRR
ncbi:MAG TPA: DUF2905 domain-containing protein [Terriglobia bacterium]|jgi:hypothetical protein|nr:DUF2905 domain-containing protein [Terriglobia bacterium]